MNAVIVRRHIHKAFKERFGADTELKHKDYNAVVTSECRRVGPNVIELTTFFDVANVDSITAQNHDYLIELGVEAMKRLDMNVVFEAIGDKKISLKTPPRKSTYKQMYKII